MTVVGWVDGDSIDPQAVAPKASLNVRNQLGHIERAEFDSRIQMLCFAAVGELFVASYSGRALPFINDASVTEDGLFAQAALVKSSANRRPPENVDSNYIARGDYRVLSDFQVIVRPGYAFVDEPIHHDAKIGSTPLPCGADEYIRNHPRSKRIANWVHLGESDSHPLMHNQCLCSPKQLRVMQISQGRVGTIGRNFQRLLTVGTKTADQITPWIWAVVSFDKNGKFLLHKQIFPTYFVYIDGKLDEKRTSKQSSFLDFVNLDAHSQYRRKDFDQESVEFEQGGCR